LLSGVVAAAPPDGWLIAGSKPGDFEIGTDTHTSYDGKTSGFIKSKVESPQGFGTLMQTFAADHYRGSRIRLSGYLKTDLAQRGQMWLRIDGPENKVLSFDNMDSRPITGTADWKRYEIVLDVPTESINIAFGFFLSGSGTIWGDVFKIEKVDSSVALTSSVAGVPKEPQNLSFEGR
jgi:hypothetical protein